MQHQQDHTQATPLVTFILAYYDLPVDMLRQCLDSILALHLRADEREVIVIDDGSPVSPLPALGKYADHIVYLRQSNSGLSEARNRGISMANGQYLQFVDADDCLIPSSYDHCLDIVRQQQPDVLMFNREEDERGARSERRAARSEEKAVLLSGIDYMSRNNLRAAAWGYLFKRSILGCLRFTPGIYHEDEEFTPLLLLRAQTVSTTDAPAYYYRRRPHSITTDTDKRKMIKRFTDCHQVIVRLNRIADTLPPQERQALSRRVAQLTMDYIYNIVRQTRSRHYLCRKLALLRRDGLYPLPDRHYTAKYTWFRRLLSGLEFL